jgi:hypothetical protein
MPPHRARRIAGLLIGGADLDIFVAGQQRQQIEGGDQLPPILLAALQRGSGGRAVGDRGPFDAVVMHDLRAGGPIRRAAGAGYILVELRIDVARARQPLIRQIPERAGADHFGDLLGAVGRGEPFGHHCRHIGRGMAQRVRQQREGVLSGGTGWSCRRVPRGRRWPASARRPARPSSPSGEWRQRSRVPARAGRRARQGRDAA